MKKKIILLVLVLTVLTGVLAGCVNKLPYKMLAGDSWGSEEIIEYDVLRKANDKQTVVGSYTSKTERINKGKVTVGNIDLNDFSGTLVTIDMALNDGSTQNSVVAFNTYFKPVASYKNIDIKEAGKSTKQTITIKYEDNKCKYNAEIDGAKKQGEIKVGDWAKKPYYDNLMIYHIARSSYYKDAFTAIDTKVFSISTEEMKTLKMSTVTANQELKLFEDSEDKIKADLIQITLNQSFPGSGAPFQVVISREKREKGEEDKTYHGLELTEVRIPLQIVEGDLTYRIKSYKNTPVGNN